MEIDHRAEVIVAFRSNNHKDSDNIPGTPALKVRQMIFIPGRERERSRNHKDLNNILEHQLSE